MRPHSVSFFFLNSAKFEAKLARISKVGIKNIPKFEIQWRKSQFLKWILTTFPFIYLFKVKPKLCLSRKVLKKYRFFFFTVKTRYPLLDNHRNKIKNCLEFKRFLLFCWIREYYSTVQSTHAKSKEWRTNCLSSEEMHDEFNMANAMKIAI